MLTCQMISINWSLNASQNRIVFQDVRVRIIRQLEMAVHHDFRLLACTV